MDNKNIIQWLDNRFAGNNSSYYAKGKQRYEWRLQRSGDLAFLLPLLIPHLVAKRRQAELLLELTQYCLANQARLGKGMSLAEREVRRTEMTRLAAAIIEHRRGQVVPEAA